MSNLLTVDLYARVEWLVLGNPLLFATEDSKKAIQKPGNYKTPPPYCGNLPSSALVTDETTFIRDRDPIPIGMPQKWLHVAGNMWNSCENLSIFLFEDVRDGSW